MDKLTKEEMQIIVNVIAQVSVPLVSKEADTLRALINKLVTMINAPTGDLPQ